MLPPGGRVVVALSGGPDSIALLHVLRELEASGELVVAGIAHFNHKLRAGASDEDARFCRDAAAELGVPVEVGEADVRSIARAEKRSVEDAGRRLRYVFLHEVAQRLHADAIAVGHSRDDQAETFLLRLLRGAGTRGLGAIRPKNGQVIRPLIDVPRAELRAFAADRGLSYREDETNADVSVPRNRVRHELLPYLARAFSPNIAEVLAHEASLARDDDDRLRDEAIDLAASIVLTNTRDESGSSAGIPADTVVVDAVRLSALHPAVGSRVAQHALAHLADGRFVGFDHVERFLEFVRAGKSGSAISLPGQQGVHAGDRVLLRPEPPREPRSRRDATANAREANSAAKPTEARGAEVGFVSPKPAEAPIGAKVGEGGNSFRVPLSIPGEVILAAEGWAVSADRAETGDHGAPDRGLAALVKGLEGPLAVRSRQPGDRFEPPGLGGRTRKLQDYLVDRKVPRSARDLLPLVVDRNDRIVWIVGHAVAEGFRAAEPSPGVILLIARHLGGEV
jgi:tRNA(Ile)-lysidine synthase